MIILFYLIIGGIAGVTSGLLGIGGGVITVPALLLLFTLQDFPKETIMLMAIGTSLASMVVNTLSSTYFHSRKNAVSWRTFFSLTPGILLGGGLGAALASYLPTFALKVTFGIFACIIGFYSAKFAKIKIAKHAAPHIFTFTWMVALVAFLSNILGIGGGIFTGPLLCYYGYSVKRAIGTSSAFSCLISLYGATAYYITSQGVEIHPFSSGYIYLPAFFAISLSSFFAAAYGVKLAHRLEIKTIRLVFSAVMVIIGVSMLFN